MTRIEIERQELLELLERVQPTLSEAEYGKLKAALETLSYGTDLIAGKETKIQQWRQLLLGFSRFPRTTEKTKDVLEKAAADGEDAASPQAGQSEASEEEAFPPAG
ncbi:MAG TPA: hypothetical protein VM120_12250 [Bryobacteraceae bacterium]|nr:hypothetical protein [Bryobacteraceae bacterium]